MLSCHLCLLISCCSFVFWGLIIPLVWLLGIYMFYSSIFKHCYISLPTIKFRNRTYLLLISYWPKWYLRFRGQLYPVTSFNSKYSRVWSNRFCHLIYHLLIHYYIYCFKILCWTSYFFLIIELAWSVSCLMP